VTRFEDIERLITRRPLPFRLAHPDESDIRYWMKRNCDKLPPLRFDCGLDDALLAGNRNLHRALAELGVGHVYQEFPGGHNWSYWQAHLRETLRFFARDLVATG
jgi:S-formylglutathione hydrolase FrmB